MNKKIVKKQLINLGIATAVFVAVFVFLIVFGAVTDNTNFMFYGIMSFVFYVLMLSINIVSLVVKIKNKKPLDIKTDLKIKDSSSVGYQLISITDKDLMNKYLEISDEFGEVGFVSFLSEGLKFSAEGKYGCIENFNNKKGYHLAFNIQGTELVKTPKDYNDVVGYEETLFNIEIGYFEDILLSSPENEKGIIVRDIGSLEGKKIQVNQKGGYIASISTAESDEIDLGEIEFVKWNDNEKIIKFKFMVSCGLCDVVAGAVKLTEDKGENN